MVSLNYSSIENTDDYNDTYGYNENDYNIFDIDIGGSAQLAPEPLPVQVRHLLTVGYVLIIGAAALSNGIVLAVVGKSRKLHTVTNTFLMSLALSDLLIALLNMPFQLQHYISHVSWLKCLKIYISFQENTIA